MTVAKLMKALVNMPPKAQVYVCYDDVIVSLEGLALEPLHVSEDGEVWNCDVEDSRAWGDNRCDCCDEKILTAKSVVLW